MFVYVEKWMVNDTKMEIKKCADGQKTVEKEKPFSMKDHIKWNKQPQEDKDEISARIIFGAR